MNMGRTGKYKGWDVMSLKNQWLQLHITPQLGGRIIQLEMKGYDFFFVNQMLFGKEPDSTRLGENGEWLNFGGEKVWPAPQGWDTLQQWPGPPDPVLDTGEYVMKVDDSSSSLNKITLLSLFDPYTGLQIKRDISISDSRSEVKIKATFINMGNKYLQWSVWPVCQMNTPVNDSRLRFQIVCPVNTESILENGFKVMHGIVNNPQNNIGENNNLTVNYQYIVGKVGLDSNGGWTGFVDRKTGKVFVLKYKSEKGESYPDDTSVQIWTQGRGMIYSRNNIKEFNNDKVQNPPYMEMELLSPLKEIPVGGNIDFEYRMLVSTIPEDETIVNVIELAVIAQSLVVKRENGAILLSAKYGVFTLGYLKIICRSDSEKDQPVILYETKVSPFKGISIRHQIQQYSYLLQNCLSVELYDKHGYFLGEIEREIINK